MVNDTAPFFIYSSNRLYQYSGPREFPDLHALSRKFVARATGTTLLGPDLVNSNNTELLNSFENAAEDGLKTMLPGPLRVLFPWYNNLYKR